MSEVKIRRIESEIISENHAKFIYENLYEKGVDLEYKYIDALIQHGYIKEAEGDDLKKNQEKASEILHRDINKSYDLQKKLEKSKKKFGEYSHSGSEIKTEEWKPESTTRHSKDFYRFISTMTFSGFQYKTYYKPLELYIQQAHNWLSENDNIDNYYTQEEKLEYAKQEFIRCKQNSLYFLDKYLMIKEADLEDDGSMKYIAKPVHEVIAFLFDCGYSMMIGKARQIAATTTFQGLFLAKMMFNRNIFVKFITMDVDSAEEMLEDKFKYPVSELEDWIRPSVSSDSATALRFSRKIKGKKGVRGGANSKINIVAPSVSAINGGAPAIVGVDEAAYIKMLGKMIRESRPTMFKYNPKTNQLEQKRQLVVWSTGATEEGEKRIKSKAFEQEFITCVNNWKKKNFDYGIVPIFFDWTTRPGVTKEFYEKEKKNYETDGPDREEQVVQFKLTWPSKYQDMFLSQSKLLVPITFIENQMSRISSLPNTVKGQWGYFEPEYDTSIEMDENSDVPYKIIGSRFVPVDDDDPRAVVQIIAHPEKNWDKRYYQGTDPIMSDNGFSKMSSAIFDAHYNTMSALLNYRDNDHTFVFLQTLLLNIYYDTREIKQGVPHLLEANIGTGYKDYAKAKGFDRSLVLNSELPEYMKGGNSDFGIDNRGVRSRMIVNKLHELLVSYGERILIEEVFNQLKTFVCAISTTGNETWGSIDKKKYHDDALFASAFAYICRLAFSIYTPISYKEEKSRFKVRYELRRDANGMLTRVPIRKKIYG